MVYILCMVHIVCVCASRLGTECNMTHSGAMSCHFYSIHIIVDCSYDGVGDTHALELNKRFPSLNTWSILHNTPTGHKGQPDLRGLRAPLQLLHVVSEGGRRCSHLEESETAAAVGTGGGGGGKTEATPIPPLGQVLDVLAVEFDRRTSGGIARTLDFVAKFCWVLT